MGVSYHVYVGPYLQIHNPPKQTVKEYYGCPNNTCRDKNKFCSSKFCPSCGTAIMLLQIPDQKPITFDTYEECKDRLSKAFYEDKPNDLKDYLILTPNLRGFGKHFSAYDAEAIELGTTHAIEEMTKFTTAYADDIIRIKEVFGTNAVAIKYGVIAYAN